jgi:hypothetical protein
MSTIDERTETNTADAAAGASLTVAAAASLAAGVIHAAAAGAHAEHRPAVVAFALLAVAQVGWGAAALARPTRWLAAAGVGLGVAAVVGWAVAKSTGLGPVAGLEQAEPAQFADTLAAGLAAVAAAGALTAGVPRLRDGRVRSLAAAVAVVAAVAGTVSTAGHGHPGGGAGHHGATDAAGGDAGGHQHGAGGATEPVAVPDDERCDLGFNTAAFNESAPAGGADHHAAAPAGEVGYTVADWAEVFTDPGRGVPVDAVVRFFEDDPVQRRNLLSGEMAHTLGPDGWTPMTDPDECATLATELGEVRAVAARYPTVADAEAAGYRQSSLYAPGQGAHYTNMAAMDDRFVAGEPEMLLFSGEAPHSPIVGVSYYVLGPEDAAPEGFAGPNDGFHRHERLCSRDGVAIGSGALTAPECASLGGTIVDDAGGWMTHAWVVPGCESDWGVFSGANPAVKIQPDDRGEVPAGCWSGRTLRQPLAFDDPGNGPPVA